MDKTCKADSPDEKQVFEEMAIKHGPWFYCPKWDPVIHQPLWFIIASLGAALAAYTN